MLPQNIFATLNQIIFYCVAVLKRAALPLHCVATRGVTRGAQFPGRRITMATPNHCAGRRKVPTMPQVLSSTAHICFRKISGQTWGRQTDFLPRAPSNLVTPLVATTRATTGLD